MSRKNSRTQIRSKKLWEFEPAPVPDEILQHTWNRVPHWCGSFPFIAPPPFPLILFANVGELLWAFGATVLAILTEEDRVVNYYTVEQLRTFTDDALRTHLRHVQVAIDDVKYQLRYATGGDRDDLKDSLNELQRYRKRVEAFIT